MIAPSPILAGCSSVRLVVERGDRAGSLPTTA
jgi:hypothetical protein